MDNNAPIRDLFMQRDAFTAWAAQYTQRLLREGTTDAERAARMLLVNPKYVLRNYMAETAIKLAETEQDYSEIDRLLALLQNPYAEQAEHAQYAGFPPDWAQQISVSCSS